MTIIQLALPMILGFILDFVLGDPYNLPHPIRLIGGMISRLEKFFRKRIPDNERLSGTLLAVVVLILSTAVPLAVLRLCYCVNVWLGAVVEGVLFYYLIAPKCLKNESMKVYTAIENNDTEAARYAVSMIVGRDTNVLDENGIIKAAVETVAENTSDGVTAPMLYTMLGGVPLGFFYKAANTMDSMIGYKNDKYLNFGRFAARLDDVLNFVPSRFTAIVMILSAFILKLDVRNAFKIWKRDRLNHASPNSAQTEAVCAGSLNIMLAGDAYYFGKLCKKKTIGDNIRPVRSDDIRKADSLMYCAAVITLVICTVFRVILWGVLL